MLGKWLRFRMRNWLGPISISTSPSEISMPHNVSKEQAKVGH